MNRPIYRNGELIDVLCGDFVIVNAPAYSEDFESLTDEQIKKCKEAFGKPHSFMVIGKKVMVL